EWQAAFGSNGRERGQMMNPPHSPSRAVDNDTDPPFRHRAFFLLGCGLDQDAWWRCDLQNELEHHVYRHGKAERENNGRHRALDWGLDVTCQHPEGDKGEQKCGFIEPDN